MANSLQGAIDSTGRVYQTAKQMQCAVHVLFCSFFEFFETLVDPIFPLESALIRKQMGFPAASGKAVIPTTYGRIDQSGASFSHGKFSPRRNQFNMQSLPNCKTNAISCACPFCPVTLHGGHGFKSPCLHYRDHDFARDRVRKGSWFFVGMVISLKINRRWNRYSM